MRPTLPTIAFSALVIITACHASATPSGDVHAPEGGASAAPASGPGTSATTAGSPTAAGMRTTAAGVFTAAQAKRGEDTYANLCTGCHTAASHTGEAFVTGWVGRPVADLFNYLTESMPKSDPGTLTPAEYSAVVAYLLRLNGMPAGQEELPSDAGALTRIRIDSSR